MGFRRRTRRRALVAGAAIAHHRDNVYAEQPQAYDQPYPGDPAAELEAQRQAVEALNDISQLQYDASMSAAGNFTP